MTEKKRPPRPSKKITIDMEIVYTYNPTPTWCAEHWMYASISGKDFADCCVNAEKYYDKQVRSLGWTKFCKFKEAKLLNHVNDKPNYKRNNSPDTTSDGGESSSVSKSNSRHSGNAKRSNGGASATAASSEQPKTNRKNARKTGGRKSAKSATTNSSNRTKRT